jgi:selenocysteine lyase/cysteine desulfurase
MPAIGADLPGAAAADAAPVRAEAARTARALHLPLVWPDRHPHPLRRASRAAAHAAAARERLAAEPRIRLVEPEGAPSLLIAFGVEGVADTAAAALRLAEQGVLVRSLPGRPYLRASVGAWTSDADLERLATAAAALPGG